MSQSPFSQRTGANGTPPILFRLTLFLLQFTRPSGGRSLPAGLPLRKSLVDERPAWSACMTRAPSHVPTPSSGDHFYRLERLP